MIVSNEKRKKKEPKLMIHFRNYIIYDIKLSFCFFSLIIYIYVKYDCRRSKNYKSIRVCVRVVVRVGSHQDRSHETVFSFFFLPFNGFFQTHPSSPLIVAIRFYIKRLTYTVFLQVPWICSKV